MSDPAYAHDKWKLVVGAAMLSAIAFGLGTFVMYEVGEWTATAYPILPAEPVEEIEEDPPFVLRLVQPEEAPPLEQEAIAEAVEPTETTGDLERDARSWGEGAVVDIVDWDGLPALSKQHAKPSDLFAIVNDEVVCKVDATHDDSEDLLAVKLDYLENRSIAAYLILKSYKEYGEVSGIQETRYWFELEQERNEHVNAIRDLGSLPSFQKIFNKAVNR